MSVMDMFRGAFGSQSAPATQQNTGAGQPGNIPQNAGATDAANTTVTPGTVAQSQVVEPAAAPLAEFAQLWEPVATEGAAADTSFLGAMDPAKVMEAASKQNFAGGMSADTLAKIQAGGPEAMQAFADAMNKTAQQVFAQSAIVSNKMIEQALTKAQDRFKADLPTQIKRHSVTDNLRQENPAFNNPAVAPLISAMEQQLTLKHPNATASEITAMAKEYISGVGSMFSPVAAKTQQQQAAESGEDWTKFFS